MDKTAENVTIKSLTTSYCIYMQLINYAGESSSVNGQLYGFKVVYFARIILAWTRRPSM